MPQSAVKTRKMTVGTTENKGNSTPTKNQIPLIKYLQKQAPETIEDKKQNSTKMKAMPTPTQRERRGIDRGGANRYDQLNLEVTESEPENESDSLDDEVDTNGIEQIYTTFADVDVEGIEDIGVK